MNDSDLYQRWNAAASPLELKLALDVTNLTFAVELWAELLTIAEERNDYPAIEACYEKIRRDMRRMRNAYMALLKIPEPTLFTAQPKENHDVREVQASSDRGVRKARRPWPGSHYAAGRTGR